MPVSSLPRDPLFAAVTRPAMKWGVTLEGLALGFMAAAMIMIGTGNPFTLLLYLPVHAVMYLVCLRDPRAFRLAYLWLETCGRSIGTRHWGAATFTPLTNARKRR
jgi:type IV secretion system protein VirB3